MCEPLHISPGDLLPQRRTPQIGPASSLAQIISVAGTELPEWSNGAISKSPSLGKVPRSRNRWFESISLQRRDGMGQAARLPTRESRGKVAGGNPATDLLLHLSTASAQPLEAVWRWPPMLNAPYFAALAWSCAAQSCTAHSWLCTRPSSWP